MCVQLLCVICCCLGCFDGIESSYFLVVFLITATIIFVITDHEITTTYDCFVVFPVGSIVMLFKTVAFLILESCFVLRLSFLRSYLALLLLDFSLVFWLPLPFWFEFLLVEFIDSSFTCFKCIPLKLFELGLFGYFFQGWLCPGKQH